MAATFKFNVIYSLIYQFFNLIIPFITAPYLARVLGPNQTGIYYETNAFAYYFFIFAMLGVNNYGNREIAKNKINKQKISETFWQIYYLQFFLTIFCFLFYLYIILEFSKHNTVIYIIQSLYVLSALFDVNWFLFGIENFKVATIRSTFVKFFTTILIFIFVK